jgi:hypothetical protein
MIPFLSLVTLVLAGIVIASVVSDVCRIDLGVKRNFERRYTIDCSNNTEAGFISDS